MWDAEPVIDGPGWASDLREEENHIDPSVFEGFTYIPDRRDPAENA